VITGLDMIGDSTSRLCHALLLCGQLMTQLCGRWLLQAMQKSPGAAIALASPTVQLIVNLSWINHNPPTKPPGSSIFTGMNQPAPFLVAGRTMYATYVLKTQETVMWPTELLTAHSIQLHPVGRYRHSFPKIVT